MTHFDLSLYIVGIVLSNTALDVAMRELDRDGDKKITYTEYCEWKRTSSWENLSLDDAKLQQRVYAAQTFDKYDKDKSGALDKSEFRPFYEELVSLGLLSGTLDQAMKKFDSDGSGKIEFSELVMWLDSI